MAILALWIGMGKKIQQLRGPRGRRCRTCYSFANAMAATETEEGPGAGAAGAVQQR